MSTRAVTALLVGSAFLAACTTPAGTAGLSTPASSTTVSSTAVSSTAVSSTAVSSTAAAGTALPTAPPTTTTEDDVPAADIPIELTVDGRVIAATLTDNPSSRDLLGQLPLTVTVRDYNRVEKTAVLPTSLTLEGAPRGSDPAPFDIGYYAPDQVLVLYYGDVGFFNGIIALGRFDPAAGDLIADLPDDATLTVTSA